MWIVSVSNQQPNQMLRQTLKITCTDVENKEENVMELEKR